MSPQCTVTSMKVRLCIYRVHICEYNLVCFFIDIDHILLYGAYIAQHGAFAVRGVWSFVFIDLKKTMA